VAVFRRQSKTLNGCDQGSKPYGPRGHLSATWLVIESNPSGLWWGFRQEPQVRGFLGPRGRLGRRWLELGAGPSGRPASDCPRLAKFSVLVVQEL
jgi:hypothetical protein